MTAQIINTKFAYVVQACVELPNGSWQWETVDSHKWQYKAIELRDHISKGNYTSVNQIYKSQYYKNWAGME